jgi:hypothetical protein
MRQKVVFELGPFIAVPLSIEILAIGDATNAY